MIRQRVYTCSYTGMRELRKEPYGVPPKPKAAGPPTEGGEKRGTPLPGTPPKKPLTPKPTP
eukprot:15432877-Alexandrium_andersonii.AAC.1